LHEHQKNKPQFAETAVIFQPVDPECPAPEMVKGIWIWPKRGAPKVYMPHLPQLITIMNPLVCPRGELIFESKLPLRQSQINENEDNSYDSDEEPAARAQRVQNDILNDNEPVDELNFETFDDLLDQQQENRDKDENMLDGIKKREDRRWASIREQIIYRMHYRAADKQVHHLWNWGVLGFLIVISIHFMVVQREFDYFSNHIEQRVIQCKYLLANYQRLVSEAMPGRRLGYVRRVPRYHKLGWQYQQRKYAEALAISRKFGSPTFFITLTGNSNWEDYLAACSHAGTDPKKSPHIMVRVFTLRLRKFMRQITGATNAGNGIFGKCLAYVVSIEFQKRGNPHAHILLWCQDYEETADYVDNFISARIPNPRTDPDLHTLVKKYMLHVCSPDSVCRDQKKPNKPCKQYYPKKEYSSTQVGTGFVKYKRIYEKADGTGGFFATKNNHHFDDRYVVPYNPYLLHFWDGHANVEFVYSPGTPGYAIKYVLKGGSKVFVEILDKGITQNPYITEVGGRIDVDEAKYQFSLSYVSVEEAITNLMSFGPFFLSHKIKFISAHLPKDITITAANGEVVERIRRRLLARRDKYSQLTAWFKFNRDNPNNEFSRGLTYTNFFKHYNYNPKTLKITPFLLSSKRIVEMYEIPLRNVQLLALRAILLHKPGLRSFEEAATHDGICYRLENENIQNVGNVENVENVENVGNVENVENIENVENVGNLENIENMENSDEEDNGGEESPAEEDNTENIENTEENFDFNAAAQAMGYIQSGLLWESALDARRGVSITRFITLFAQVLLQANFTAERARALWNQYKTYMTPPLGRLADETNVERIRTLKEQIALRILQTHLNAQGKSLQDFGLGRFVDSSVNVPDYNPDIHGEEATEYLRGNFSEQT
ncbi:hypothetical protein ZOSMA_3866G00010, partial [Zostera marina]